MKSRARVDGEKHKLIEYLKNRKHFACFHTVIETRVEVWENKKLKWKHKPTGQVFRAISSPPKLPQEFYNVWEHRKNVFYFFYKITHRKLKL